MRDADDDVTMTLYGRQTIYGVEGEHDTPYLTRWWFGRLRFHIFHRGDADPDLHDHPWGFWTFPLTSYIEETVDPVTYRRSLNVVRAFRLHYRPATYTHRVLGRFDGFAVVFEHGQDGLPLEYNVVPTAKTLALQEDGTYRYRPGSLPVLEPVTKPGRIVTLVWRGRQWRKWGFLKKRDGRWCWQPWKEYIFNGGKDAPCS